MINPRETSTYGDCTDGRAVFELLQELEANPQNHEACLQDLLKSKSLAKFMGALAMYYREAAAQISQHQEVDTHTHRAETWNLMTAEQILVELFQRVKNAGFSVEEDPGIYGHDGGRVFRSDNREIGFPITSLESLALSEAIKTGSDLHIFLGRNEAKVAILDIEAMSRAVQPHGAIKVIVPEHISKRSIG